MIKSKKGAEGTIWIVMVIALLLLFLFVYFGVWAKLFGKSASGIDNQISSAGDFDNDGVINIVDKCPCVPGGQENNGCPTDYKITGSNSDKENRDCLAKK